MGHMLAACLSEKYVSCVKHDDFFFSAFPEMHIDRAIQNREHFLAAIDVPPIGLIRPVQAGRRAAHIGNIQRGPRLTPGEFFAAKNPHGCLPPYDAQYFGERRAAAGTNCGTKFPAGSPDLKLGSNLSVLSAA